LNVINEQAKRLFASLDVTNEQAKGVFACLNVINEQAKSAFACLNVINGQAKSAFACLNVINEQAKSVFACLNVINEQAKSVFACLNVINEQAKSVFACLNVIKECLYRQGPFSAEGGVILFLHVWITANLTCMWMFHYVSPHVRKDCFGQARAMTKCFNVDLWEEPEQDAKTRGRLMSYQTRRGRPMCLP
jgi:hypothetical protein